MVGIQELMVPLKRCLNCIIQHVCGSGRLAPISKKLTDPEGTEQMRVAPFADSLENVAHLAPFNRELMFVVDVLVGTAAATAKIRALRCDPMQGAFFNFHQLRFGELLFFAQDLGGNCFALNCIRNKDSLPLFPADAFSAKGKVLDFQIDNAHGKNKASNC